MSVVTRGVKNAFRNVIRSFSITLILGISIALALVMLLAMRAVQARITSVQSSIGNIITITPAGARGFAGGGEPLTDDNLAAVKSTAHVTKVTSSISDRLNTTGTNSNFPGQTDSNSTTILVSSINAGTLGRRFGRAQQNNGGTTPANFTLPIMVSGTTDPTSTQVAG